MYPPPYYSAKAQLNVERKAGVDVAARVVPRYCVRWEVSESTKFAVLCTYIMSIHDQVAGGRANVVAKCQRQAMTVL